MRGTPCPRRCGHARRRCGPADRAIHPTRRPWRDCTRLIIGGDRAHGGGIPDRRHWPGGAVRTMWSDDHSAPAVGSLGGTDQHIAQFTQFSGFGTFVERRGDILRGASDLVNAIRQVGRLVRRQHHGISRQGREGPRLTPVDRSPLLVGPLTARLSTILTAPAHPDFGDVSTAPAAWLWVATAAHACRL